MVKKWLGILMLGSLWGCITGIHHPSIGILLRSTKKLTITEYEETATGRWPITLPTEHYGVTPVTLAAGRDLNGFYYGIDGIFLISKGYSTVTIHEITLITNGQERVLSSEEPEVFLFNPSGGWKLRDADGKLYLNDKDYFTLIYSNEEQKKRLTKSQKRFSGRVTFVPVFDLLKVLRDMGVKVKRGMEWGVDKQEVPVSMRITYQLDDDAPITYTNHFILNTEAGHTPTFGA